MNIRENIREQKYENTKPWPTRPDRFPEAQVQREEYYKMERVIEAAFMDDLRHYVETLGVPHQYSTKLCSKAWEDGHASGLDEVVTHAELIAEIFN